MAHFRNQKQRFMRICAQENWMHVFSEEITDAAGARTAINPLLALLNRPECRWQAVFSLSLCLPLIAEENMESARVFMRRLMWSLNEESGNLGWGIPEAMGAILARSPALTKEYGRIFLSYGYETGKDDNFLDHAPLRRGVYWGIGRLAEASPEAAKPALPHLVAALGDGDLLICAMAAWALGKLAAGVPDEEFAPPLGAESWLAAQSALEREEKARSHSGQMHIEVELLEGETIVSRPLADILKSTTEAIHRRLG